MVEERLNIDFGSDKEYVAKFLLTPDIEDFDHFDKNIKTTNLRSKFREPEYARAILKALHILTNKKYMDETEKTILLEEKTVEATRIICVRCGYHNLYGSELKAEEYCQSCEDKLNKGSTSQVMVSIPLYQKKRVFSSRYPKIYNALHSAWRSLVETSSARDGHLIKAVNTRKIEREETIEDRTTVKSQGVIGGLLGGSKKRGTDRGGGY